MRKALVIVVAALLVLSLVPAAAAPSHQEWQFEQGSIASPTRFTDLEGGWPGLGRRIYNCSAATNGTIMWIFDVYEETRGGVFIIDDVSDATGSGNIDVYFYEEFGDCGGQKAPVTTGEFAERAPGGEVGHIPDRTRYAVVFTPDAVDATFRYRGFLPPEIRLGTDTLDVTVAVGGMVRWVNATGDYAFVRSADAGFDSGDPEAGRGIPIGGSFQHTFTSAGTYTYETSTGSGTITVLGSVRDLDL